MANKTSSIFVLLTVVFIFLCPIYTATSISFTNLQHSPSISTTSSNHHYTQLPLSDSSIQQLFTAGDPLFTPTGQIADIKYFDRISTIIQFNGPNNENIIIAGLGARDYDVNLFPYDDSYLIDNCILRSADGGLSWIAITPEGKTDRKVYGLSTNNKGIVVAVTGDRGNPSILNSVDYGLTWKNVFSTSQIGSTASLYNSYHSASREIFIVPTGKGTYLSSNGIDWAKSTSISLPLGRNGYSVEELKDEIFIATTGPTLQKLPVGSNVTQTMLTAEDNYLFSAFRYLGCDGRAGCDNNGNGVMLAAAFQDKQGKVQSTQRVFRFSRQNGITTLTIPNHNITLSSLLSMSIPLNDPIYSPVQNNLIVRVFDRDTIKFDQPGPNVPTIDVTFKVKITTSELASKIRLFRSTDYGTTWQYQDMPGILWNYNMMWTRDFINVGKGVVYFNLAGFENLPDDNAAALYKSIDYGKSWTLTDDIISPTTHENVNAIYRSFNIYPTSIRTNNDQISSSSDSGFVLLGAQNQCRIFKLNKN